MHVVIQWWCMVACGYSGGAWLYVHQPATTIHGLMVFKMGWTDQLVSCEAFKSSVDATVYMYIKPLNRRYCI